MLASASAFLALAVVPAAAQAGDAGVVRAQRTLYPAAERAAQRATTAEGFQASYDAARDLQEGLRAAAPLSPRCATLRAALDRYAAGRVLEMEGVDRPSAGDRVAALRPATRTPGLGRSTPSISSTRPAA